MIDFIKSKTPINICDIGASPIDKTDFIQTLFDNCNSKIIGFEPNIDEFKKLERSNPKKKFYNYALGDGKDKTLNICKAPGMSSFLEPNYDYLKIFHSFEEWSEIVSKQEVTTKKLNDVDEILDFIKLDVQGYEYEILKYGQKKIKEAKVIQIETSPFPIYKNEKSMSEIIKLLENHGFMLHMFNKINTRSFKPMVVANNKNLGINHLFQLDCVMVKNFKEIKLLDKESLMKLILIMFYSFKSYDFVDYLITILDDKFKTSFIEKYRALHKDFKINKKY